MPRSMSSLIRLSLALSCLTSGASFAQTSDQVIGLQPGVAVLSVFAKPYDTVTQAQLAAGTVALPLPVLAVDRDFLKVRLAGKEVWLDGAEVSVSKAVPYNCVVADKPIPTAKAATMGASKGCK